ncbi:V-type ATPase subunit [Petrotoga sp. 9PWA.NaAc.5.4]|uniref:V-type ATPase subunit n=1 Tax=Petrotoga sp. 9PWA.NaAc.5.4 TaxID=1434328 RepID=UPI000CC3B45B|nr:V-type ATPase subunit [Petrotoga sp. 9PWA.NaAc.5.4]PNR92503.1 ATPase [Petrotoga sp. 9PWA.NaAc.5.4]
MKLPGLMTKVKALDSKILNEIDYQNLINTTSVTEIVEYLKNNTHYSKSFENVEVSLLHRRDVEVLLRKSILQDFYHIHFYLPIKEQKLFKLIVRRFEVENIKFILRSLHAEHPEYVKKEKLFPVPYKTIDLDSLISVKTFDDVLNVLRNSAYKSVIDSAYSNYQKTKKLQYLLNTFDFWYFSLLKAEFEKSKEFKKNLSFLFFEQMDLINVQWIYRAKVLFKLSREEVLNLLLPFSFKLTRNDIENLVNTESVEDFINVISTSFYGKYFKNKDKNIFSYIIERICDKILLEDSKKLMANTMNGLFAMSGYLYLREYEYKDLVTLIEGKRYQIPNEKIRNFLLLAGE